MRIPSHLQKVETCSGRWVKRVAVFLHTLDLGWAQSVSRPRQSYPYGHPRQERSSKCKHWALDSCLCCLPLELPHLVPYLWQIIVKCFSQIFQNAFNSFHFLHFLVFLGHFALRGGTRPFPSIRRHLARHASLSLFSCS
jgi:hypothetical protein